MTLNEILWTWFFDVVTLLRGVAWFAWGCFLTGFLITVIGHSFHAADNEPRFTKKQVQFCLTGVIVCGLIALLLPGPDVVESLKELLIN